MGTKEESTQEGLAQERLLKEYEVGFQYASYHAQIIWQTASIFLSVSLAGLAYFSTSRPENWISVISRVVIYIGMAILIEGWFYLFRRWNGYMSIGFTRMNEIEETLKEMFLIRYGQVLRKYKLEKRRPVTNNKHLDDFLDLVDEQYRDFPLLPQQKIVRLICFLLDLGWLALFVSDILYVSYPH